MKILYLCPDLGIPVLGSKGASVHVRNLVNAMVRAGHRVFVAAPIINDSSPEAQRLQATLLHVPPSTKTEEALHGMELFNQTLQIDNSLTRQVRRMLYNQTMVTQLKRRFEIDPPDIIYERASPHSIAGVTLGHELDRPTLVELNAPLAIEQSIYRTSGLEEVAAQAERWTLCQASAVFVVSAPLRDHVLSFGVEPNNVHLLPNAVEPAWFQPSPPDPVVSVRWDLHDRLVLGFVGGLRKWHGVQSLPELLERLIPRYPELRLVIVGDGPLHGELEHAVRQRGLAHSVVFTGSVPHEEVGNLIRRFDVALAPYPVLEHPFYFSPLKLFEYMACGVAVVAARQGQLAEMVRHGETGLLYPPGDLDAMTAACERLLTDSGLRRKLGRSAANVIHGRYTWDHNATLVTELGRSLLAARKVAADT